VAQARPLLSLSELKDAVSIITDIGEFAFDVETRGNIERHAEVMALIESEWKEKEASLKSLHPTTVQRSRQAIEDKWKSNVAVDPLRNDVFWIGLATKGHSWAIPMGHPNGEILVPERRGDGSTVPPPGHRTVLASGKESLAKAKYFIPATFTSPPEQLTAEQVFDALEPLFMDEAILKIGHNIKFDAKSVAKYYGGILPKGRYVDTMVLMHIINEDLMSYNLGGIIKNLFDFDPYFRDGKIGKTITTESFSKACRYVHYDARWTWLAYKKLMRLISQEPSLFKPMFMDLDLLPVLAQMEMNGIAVNKRAMSKLGKDLELDLNNLLVDMYQYAPPGFNPGSNAHKVELLFNKKRDGGLGLTPKNLTPKGKPSVDDDSLRSLKGKHPIIEMLMSYSETRKMKTTYVEGLLPLLHNGRLHPQFHLHRTATGRMSSSEPNLQNIPRDGRVRSLFIAPPDETLIVADYSQIEMRIMAMFSQDPALLKIFTENIDIHAGTAGVILHKDPSDVTSEERNIYGKVPNFLMGYGGGPKRLVEATNGQLSLEEAKKVVENYNSGYGVMTAWKQDQINRAYRRGFVETMNGRRRRLPDLQSNDFATRARAERQAISAIVQGSASEVCKEAMLALNSALPFPRCKILVQVHDELVCSVPLEEVNSWIPVVEQAMGNGRVIEGVSLEVEAHHAGSWSEAKG